MRGDVVEFYPDDDSNLEPILEDLGNKGIKIGNIVVRKNDEIIPIVIKLLSRDEVFIKETFPNHYKGIMTKITTDCEFIVCSIMLYLTYGSFHPRVTITQPK